MGRGISGEGKAGVVGAVQTMRSKGNSKSKGLFTLINPVGKVSEKDSLKKIPLLCKKL